MKFCFASTDTIGKRLDATRDLDLKKKCICFREFTPRAVQHRLMLVASLRGSRDLRGGQNGPLRARNSADPCLVHGLATVRNKSGLVVKSQYHATFGNIKPEARNQFFFISGLPINRHVKQSFLFVLVSPACSQKIWHVCLIAIRMSETYA